MKQHIISASLFFIFTTVLLSQQSVYDEENNLPDSKQMKAAAEANNTFAFELYSEYKNENGNIFFSPYSIHTALSMTYEGAKGETAHEMKTVLHLPENAELIRITNRQLYTELNRNDKPYKLTTANALWAQQNFKFRTDYFDLIKNYYGGKAVNLDFINNPENSRLVINQWVEEKTNYKIKDLVPSGALDIYTRLVLTNAIYFKGMWVKQFNKDETKEQDFNISPTNKVKVPMMQRTDSESIFNYAETGDVQILEMPYEGNDLSILMILPKNGLESIENALNQNYLENLKESLTKQRVNIYIPRFRFETKYHMKKTLSKMGMHTAFSDMANFTGMEDDPLYDLKISKVIHQAFVELNEEGTEAAAATAVIMVTRTSVHTGHKIPVFRADHPFVFIIQHKKTGNILFLGRVNDPR